MVQVVENGKMYIGQTCQEDPNIRWKNGRGYVGNDYFTNSINKYSPPEKSFMEGFAFIKSNFRLI